MQVPLFRLQCGVNSYGWGKVGSESAAAKYASATPSDGFEVEADKPYAELWMGTHPSLPSKDVETGQSLLELVQTNLALMTPAIVERYGGKLPFLFKILSIGKALSIQAHPNKKLAEQLHARDSKNYPDDNHKPEMTIAVTPFEGLCGFRPLAEIVHFLRAVEPLRNLVGAEAAEAFENAVKGQEQSQDEQTMRKNKAALREVFTKLMQASAESVETATTSLISIASSSPESLTYNDTNLSELIIRLNGQFPNDIGLFVLFFLNFIKLSPGEAMFLKADDIHAYISGDIVECMASSDNVVRAGFTPKFKDVSTLTSMLTYSYAPIEEQKMEPAEYPYMKMNTTAYSSGSTAVLYDPPIEEFSVLKIDLRAKGSKATLEPIEGPSIIICTAGEGRISVGPAKSFDVKEGFVFFVGATAECVLESATDGEMTLFKAFCELENTANL